MNLTQSEQKKLAAVTAVDALIAEGRIFSGMKIGLGTGSTAMPAVTRIAERIKDGTLSGNAAIHAPEFTIAPRRMDAVGAALGLMVHWDESSESQSAMRSEASE